MVLDHKEAITLGETSAPFLAVHSVAIVRARVPAHVAWLTHGEAIWPGKVHQGPAGRVEQLHVRGVEGKFSEVFGCRLARRFSVCEHLVL